MGALSIALQVLGASAGITALMTFVGGAMLWIRFTALHLPADQAVNLLPKNLLLVVGAHALFAPVLVGLFAAIVLFLTDPARWDPPAAKAGTKGSGEGATPQQRRIERATVVAGAIALLVVIVLLLILIVVVDAKIDSWELIVGGAVAVCGVVALAAFRRKLRLSHLRMALVVCVIAPFLGVVVALVWNFDLWPEQIVMAAAGLLALVTVAAVVHAHASRAQVAWVVFAAFSLCGAVLAVVRTSGAPRMEPVAVLLKERPKALGGFYVGQTSDRLYIAPLPGKGDPADPFADADINSILEIDRDQVRQMALREPTGIGNDQAGRVEAQDLVAGLRSLASGAAPPRARRITTADPVTAFAPLVHLHAHESAWPMSADRFLRHSWLGWAHDHGCPDWTPGSHAEVSDLPQHRDLIGTFDPAFLAGPHAYRHRQTDDDCHHEGAIVPASAHTRPYDTRKRVRGLDLTEGYYLDLDDRQRHGDAQAVGHEGGHAVFTGVPVYYETDQVTRAGQSALRITYWFFYGLSQPPGPPAVTQFLVHEGDWERISVLLATGVRHDAYTPILVTYYTHDTMRDVAWAAVQRTRSGSGPATHPVVYSARGSHASYWHAGRYENVYRADRRRLFGVDDDAISCPACPQWRTWEQLLSARAQPWYGFGGAWGAVGQDSGRTGPLGPSPYKTVGIGRNPTKTVHEPSPPASVPVTPSPRQHAGTANRRRGA